MSNETRPPTFDEVAGWYPILKTKTLKELENWESEHNPDASEWIPWVEYDKGSAKWRKTCYDTSFSVMDEELWLDAHGIDEDGDRDHIESVMITNNPHIDKEYQQFYDAYFNYKTWAKAIHEYDCDVAISGDDPLELYFGTTAEERKHCAKKAVRQAKIELDKTHSNLCPACGIVDIDSWACKLICHNCGTRFTCDE